MKLIGSDTNYGMIRKNSEIFFFLQIVIRKVISLVIQFLMSEGISKPIAKNPFDDYF